MSLKALGQAMHIVGTNLETNHVVDTNSQQIDLPPGPGIHCALLEEEKGTAYFCV